MRSRSGGIHSNSEQQYIELADIAQHCKSLFYDEPKKSPTNKRRKYAFSVNDPKSNSSDLPPKQQKPPEKKKAFESFNFDQQSYSFAKDCEQLKKVEQSAKKKTRKTNFTILSSLNTYMVSSILENILGIERKTPEGPPRALNLCVHRVVGSQENQLYIDCYWIIDTTHFSAFECLLNVYIQKSSEVLNLGHLNMEAQQTHHKLEVLNNEIRGLVDRVSRGRLEYH